MALASVGTLENYRLVQLLAQGGMGEVYLACREGPEGFLKEVVIKCMLKHLAEDQGFVELFLNEARLAVLLQHPNIVQTLELNRAGDSWFIVMEHVRGRSLKSCIRRAKKNCRQIPKNIAVWLIAEALQGLHFAHNLADGAGRPLGILHRDVSPDNLLLSWDGAVKLVDFGISKARFRVVNLPTGGPKGKFPYMAPEYFVGDNALDVRSDVYSMGVTLHELLTLELPNCVPRDRKNVSQPRIHYQPRAELPEELNTILSKALNPNPAERWGSAAEMAEALIKSLVAKGQSVHASTVSAWMRDFWDLGPDETFSEFSEWEAPAELSSLQSESGGIVGTEVLSAPETIAKKALALQPIPRRRTPKQNLLQGLATAACFISIALLYWALISPNKEAPSPALSLSLVPQPPAAMASLPSVSVDFEHPQHPAPESIAEKPIAEKHPEKKPPETKTPEPKNMGLVHIKAPPNTIVRHKGKRLGKTPMRRPLQLPAGKVRLHMQNKALGISNTYHLRIEPGKEVVLQVKTPKAHIRQP
ncbi:MAG: protein kinase [Cystobacterineae bacterium]|nr:protein kinase [Cystobacterineae bacterium]